MWKQLNALTRLNTAWEGLPWNLTEFLCSNKNICIFIYKGFRTSREIRLKYIKSKTRKQMNDLKKRSLTKTNSDAIRKNDCYRDWL